VLKLIQGKNKKIETMTKDKSMKYTCLFGGGAIRGTAYAGTMRAMEELGINPNTYAGSSVGAVFAGLAAVGYSADELEALFYKFNFEMFRDVQISLGANFALSKGEVFLEWIRDLIEQKFYGEKYKKGSHKAVTFKDIDKNLVIITTDLSSFECKEFSRYETPDFEIATAIRISCGMPGLMRAYEYNNRTLVDGDLQKSWPMWKLSKALQPEDERILEFRLEGVFEGNDKNTIEYVNAIYAFTTSMATAFIVDLYGKKDKYDYIVINTGDINIVDFNLPEEKRRNLVKIGYSQTMDYFNEVLPAKKQHLLSMYKEIQNKLLRIEKHLTKQNILKAKSVTAEMFIDLYENKEFLDEKLCNKITNFKDEFYQNIQYPALFGKTSIKNKSEIDNDLKYLLNEVNERIDELESYLCIEKV